MTNLKPDSQQDSSGLRWSRLEDEREACVVVSDRMELVYINTAARELVPGEWFGKRCFEVLPTAAGEGRAGRRTRVPRAGADRGEAPGAASRVIGVMGRPSEVA